MKTNVVMLAGIHIHTYGVLLQENNLIIKNNTNKVSVINDTVKKSYM